MRLPRKIYNELAAESKKALPAECCGFLAGKNELVSHCFPLINVAKQGEYEADSKSVIVVEGKIRMLGLEMLAVYHSHPYSAAVPSRGDLRYGFPKGIIISLQKNEPEIRAWNNATEIELIIED